MADNYWTPNNVAHRLVERMQAEAETDESGEMVYLSGGDAARLMDQIARSWEVANAELVRQRDDLVAEVERLRVVERKALALSNGLEKALEQGISALVSTVNDALTKAAEVQVDA